MFALTGWHKGGYFKTAHPSGSQLMRGIKAATSDSAGKTLKRDASNLFSQGVQSTYTRSVCEICNRSFAYRSGLKRHKIVAHAAASLPFVCTLCTKGFSEKHHYEGHMNVHYDVKPYICPYCSKSHAYRTGLNCHMKVCKFRLK